MRVGIPHDQAVAKRGTVRNREGGGGGGGGGWVVQYINSVMKMITNTKSLPMHSLHYAKSLKVGIFPRAKSPVC